MTPQEYREELVNEYFNELNEFYKAHQKMIVSLWEFEGGTIEEWNTNRELKIGFIVKLKTLAEQGIGLRIA
jgi:hypothetical protein